MGEIKKEPLQVSIFKTPFDSFDYYYAQTEHGQTPTQGSRVKVLFRKRMRIGIVIGHAPSLLPEDRIQPILDCLDPIEPILPTDILSLCQFIANYYHAPLSHVLTLAIPKKIREGQTIHTPLKKPTIELNHQDTHQQNIRLHQAQADAIDTIIAQHNAFHCFLLYGVTGSGKTEVYLQLTQFMLKQQKQVLILVPEIGLTPQLVSRFQARFNAPIGVLHSNISDQERAFVWENAKKGTLSILIGTRTALFTPLPHLGLILIDEEQDPSFKQMETVHFSARDMAIVRAHQKHIPIVLGSATPSLESYHHTKTGKYTLLLLPHRAIEHTPLYFELVDTRLTPVTHGLSPRTLEMIQTTLNNHQQVLIFINRRGFSPVWLCTQCQWIADCTGCNRHLTLHKDQRLRCHHCHYSTVPPSTCPSCTQSAFVPIGIGTQRIDEYLKTCFPDTTFIRMDRDAIKKEKDWHQALQDILENKIQIIIGTQMIAKGHHFPNVHLVIILDVDLGLYHPDFYAQEHLGQLITQVAGRTGRAGTPGHVIIQTSVPHHPMLNLLVQKNYTDFMNAQLKERQAAEWPPYTFLALISAYGKEKQNVIMILRQLQQQLHDERLFPLKIFGPAPAPQEKKAHHFHMQLLLKSKTRTILHEALNIIKKELTSADLKGIKLTIDIDPIDLH